MSSSTCSGVRVMVCAMFAFSLYLVFIPNSKKHPVWAVF
jgi:hypothetical protein